MKEAFIERTFSAANATMIQKINRVLEEYRRQGYRLSLRQLYYQLVARDIIPNSLRSYKNIGNLVSNARQAGLIDWGMIEDRNRDTNIPGHWDSPGEIVAAAAQQFRIDKWREQPYHIEVMVEKDALSGVLVPVCRELDIGITANKGYCSSSTMYEIGKRIDEKRSLGKKICILYLGDHDPSGIDMTRDVRERLEMYSRLHSIEVDRLALNWEQIEIWQPPENPAKETDSRFSNYARQFGESSWELDAVEPAQLAELVKNAVMERRDAELWNDAWVVEEHMRSLLFEFAKKYDDRDDEEGER
ncbi:MAG: hypothetical protein ACYC36_00220 [Bellilinea sp.]